MSKESSCGVMANVLGCCLKVSEFKLNGDAIMFTFGPIPLVKVLNLLIPTSYGLNNIKSILLQVEL